jgi:hypothetical protein
VLQDALNSLVAPDAVRQLDLAKGVVERVDDLVDCVACVGGSGLQPHDPSVEVPRERPEHMYVKGVLGGSEEDEERQTVSKVCSTERETGDRTCATGRRRRRTSCQRGC